MVEGAVIDLELVVPVSYFVSVLYDVVIEAFAVNIGFELLTDLNVKVSTAVMPALEFPIPIPLEEEFSCSAPFGSRDLNVFNWDRVLQIRIPSNHV